MTVLLLVAFLGPMSTIAQTSSPVVPASIEQTNTGSGRRILPLGQSSPSAVPEDFATLRLAPGFLVQMDVYDVPDMTLQLRVDASGDVEVPLIGHLHLAGLTASESQRLIANSLVKGEILKDPQVTLNILQFSAQNISVFGEVQSPGRVQLLSPRPLQDILSLVGGETLAASNIIEIHRNTDPLQPSTTMISYSPGKDSATLRNTVINPGDSIYVRRAGVIYVLGAVTRPGGYLMVDGGNLNVLEAISLASGTTPQASVRQMRIIHQSQDSFKETTIPYAKMVNGQSQPAQLEPNDILYVPTSTAKSILINGSSIIGAAVGASLYRVP